MWHASVSAWSRRTRQPVNVPQIVERAAINALTGVGGDREWWIHTPTLIGHLRVALTPDEYATTPPGIAHHDAGESGPQRPRTRE